MIYAYDSSCASGVLAIPAVLGEGLKTMLFDL